MAVLEQVIRVAAGAVTPLREAEATALEALFPDLQRVSQETALRQVLARLRADGADGAFVTDAYGRIVGLVTREELTEREGLEAA